MPESAYEQLGKKMIDLMRRGINIGITSLHPQVKIRVASWTDKDCRYGFEFGIAPDMFFNPEDERAAHVFLHFLNSGPVQEMIQGSDKGFFSSIRNSDSPATQSTEVIP